MLPSAFDVHRATAGLRNAQLRLDRLLEEGVADGRLDDRALGAPSLLPGWSRGHVLTHLARNADSITRALRGALDGTIADRYPGPPGTRDRDIEAGASRSTGALLADVAASAAALDETLDRMTPSAWAGTTRRVDRIEPVAALPWRRWRELELHRVDLDLGDFGIADWEPDFVAAEGQENGEPDADRFRVAELTGRFDPDPAAWTAATLPSRWCRSLSAAEVDLLDDVLERYRGSHPDLTLEVPAPEALSRSSGAGSDRDGDQGAGAHRGASSSGLEGLQTFAAAIREELVTGPGVVAFEGFPVGRYPDEELRVIWWLLSCAIGSPRAQSHRGDLIGDVRDIGTGISGRAGRGYTSNAELNFHADVCDASGLFFLRTAREGGVTRIASSVSTHDRMAEQRPDLLRELYRPMPCSWQGNQPEGERGWYPMSVFGRTRGRTSCAYVRTNIVLAAQNAGAPPLTEAQRQAVELVRDTASEDDLWVERAFAPGTILFVHNHTVLHLRTAFTDWDEPERRRHLLRTWLSLPNNRRLPSTFASFFGDLDEGALRGGYASRRGDYTFGTE